MPAETALTVGPQLCERAQAILKALKGAGLSIVTAESCTAGMIAAVLSRGRRQRSPAWRLRDVYEGTQDLSPRRLCRFAARKGRGQRRGRDAPCAGSAEAFACFCECGRQRSARTRGGRGRQPGGTGLFLLCEIERTSGRRERRIREEEARAAFAAYDSARLRPYRRLRRRVPRLIGTAAARRTRHSSSVLDAFDRLHGRHAVARLVRALEPP